MHTIAIIPARIGSYSFPIKPLAQLLCHSMIEHLYHRTAMCRSQNDVFVVTYDYVIRDVVEEFGGKDVMASATHELAK